MNKWEWTNINWKLSFALNVKLRYGERKPMKSQITYLAIRDARESCCSQPTATHRFFRLRFQLFRMPASNFEPSSVQIHIESLYNCSQYIKLTAVTILSHIFLMCRVDLPDPIIKWDILPSLPFKSNITTLSAPCDSNAIFTSVVVTAILC